jgi:hypothetical protein
MENRVQRHAVLCYHIATAAANAASAAATSHAGTNLQLLLFQ